MTYVPSQSNPSDVYELRRWVQSELNRIAERLTTVNDIPEYAVEPKQAEGRLARADGTGWNPGSGAGLYIFQGGAWVFIV